MIYGGNLGKPQGVDFICDFIKFSSGNPKLHFLIIGSGTEKHKVTSLIINDKLKNITLLDQLPRDEYLSYVMISDIGLIFLDHRFTIPNFPSRILDYMLCEKPIFAAVDKYTDLGSIIEENGFGMSTCSDSLDKASSKLSSMLECDLQELGKKRENISKGKLQ